MDEPKFDPTGEDLEQRMLQALAEISPEKLAGVRAVIQLNVLGESPQEWIWTIQDGVCTPRRGKAENPSLLIEATAQDFLKILSGKLSPMAAAALGRLEVSGNMQLAMSMVNFLRQSTPQDNSQSTTPGQVEGTG